MGLDIVWSHLALVNLKNGYYVRSNGPGESEAEWKRFMTTGHNGLSSWSRTAAYLKQKDYKGAICLTAEYSDESLLNEWIAQDIAYAKALFN